MRRLTISLFSLLAFTHCGVNRNLIPSSTAASARPVDVPGIAQTGTGSGEQNGMAASCSSLAVRAELIASAGNILTGATQQFRVTPSFCNRTDVAFRILGLGQDFLESTTISKRYDIAGVVNEQFLVTVVSRVSGASLATGSSNVISFTVSNSSGGGSVGSISPSQGLAVSDPGGYDFGALTFSGETRLSHSFTVTNTSLTTLQNLSGVVTGLGFTAATTNCGNSLAPAASCFYVVEIRITGSGLYSGNLSVTATGGTPVQRPMKALFAASANLPATFPNCQGNTLPLYHYFHFQNAHNDGDMMVWHSFYRDFPAPLAIDKNSFSDGKPLACMPMPTDSRPLNNFYVLYSPIYENRDQRFYTTDATEVERMRSTYGMAWAATYKTFAQQQPGTIALVSCDGGAHGQRILSVKECTDYTPFGFRVERRLGFVFPGFQN